MLWVLSYMMSNNMCLPGNGFLSLLLLPPKGKREDPAEAPPPAKAAAPEPPDEAVEEAVPDDPAGPTDAHCARFRALGAIRPTNTLGAQRSARVQLAPPPASTPPSQRAVASCRSAAANLRRLRGGRTGQRWRQLQGC